MKASDNLLTAKEAAVYAACSVYTIYRAVKGGYLQHGHVGGAGRRLVTGKRGRAKGATGLRFKVLWVDQWMMAA